jgi:hypothetical protein
VSLLVAISSVIVKFAKPVLLVGVFPDFWLFLNDFETVEMETSSSLQALLSFSYL